MDGIITVAELHTLALLTKGRGNSTDKRFGDDVSPAMRKSNLLSEVSEWREFEKRAGKSRRATFPRGPLSENAEEVIEAMSVEEVGILIERLSQFRKLNAQSNVSPIQALEQSGIGVYSTIAHDSPLAMQIREELTGEINA